MNTISPRKSWLRASWAFLAVVVGPLLVLGVYYAVLASDRYVSEAKISIKRSSASELAAVGGLVSAGLATPDTRTDALYLREHILSLDMLDYLDAKFGLHRAYTDPKIDFFSRLWSLRNLGGEPTREEFLDYYRNLVDVSYDDNSSIITIAVQGFTPEFARQVSQAIVAHGEEFINGISQKLANDQLDFVARELRHSQDRLLDARNSLIAFQNQYQVLDPAEQAKATAAYINTMEADVAQQEAELKNLLTYVSQDAFQVQSLRGKIGALKAQLTQEKARLSGNGAKGKLNEVAARFLNL
ncbi:MAG TPA: capsular biosynthesis protein, partial [Burkholderiales bacterium]